MSERAPSAQPPGRHPDGALDEVLSRFEEAWRSGKSPGIDDYLEPAMPDRMAVLVELVHTDIEYRLKGGFPCRVEEYRSRYPELAADREAELGIIEAEYGFRRRLEPSVDVEEYRLRFPEYGDELARRLLGRPAEVGAPRIRGYTISGVIGRGGMSVVYKARDEALKRPVALKMILPALHGPEGNSRFRSEAEAVARLQHPNIVQIFEVGETDGSPGVPCPYIALEYADGGSLDRMLLGRPQAPRRGAGLVEILAHAVHAAHDRGIVHRDLKPANILWAAGGAAAPASDAFFDGGGLPKIADFGLAKLLDDESTTTKDGQLLGTPSYMAPEQAEGRQGEVGPGCDIYALGAILYELLTGRPPFVGSSAAETLEQVKTLEPLRPSRLQPGTPRDLETICLKCLEKEPARRYETAAELANDLRNFLDGRPIAARPVTGLGRAYRWCRRNPWVAGLASAFLIALVVGLTVSTTQWLRAERNLVQANRARDVAYDRFGLALDAIKSFHTGASEDVLLKEAKLEGLRKRLLMSPLEFYKRLAADLESDDDTDEKRQANLAEAYYQLAEVTADVGSKEDALGSYRNALAMREKLPRGGLPERRALAANYSAIGKLQLLTGHPKDAIRTHNQALASLVEAAHAYPNDPQLGHDRARCLINLGVAYTDAASRGDAVRSYREALSILESLHEGRPADVRLSGDIAKTYFDLGLLESRAGQLEAALGSYRKSLAVLEPSAKQKPGAEAAETLAATHNSMGIVLKYLGRLPESRQALERAREYRMGLVADHPTSTAFQHALVDVLVNLGVVDAAIGQDAEARLAYSNAVKSLRKLLEENPRDARSQRSLAGCLIFLASLQQKENEPDSALRSLDEARVLLEKLPATADTQYNLACVLAQHVPIFARTRANSGREQRQYADLAMDALRRAVAGGFRNLAVAQNDSDLIPLRSRADFQALVGYPNIPEKPFAP